MSSLSVVKPLQQQQPTGTIITMDMFQFNFWIKIIIKAQQLQQQRGSTQHPCNLTRKHKYTPATQQQAEQNSATKNGDESNCDKYESQLQQLQLIVDEFVVASNASSSVRYVHNTFVSC